MSIEVINPGMLTTVQDGGRFGYQHLGVTPSGAMDSMALRTANLLVHNSEQAAALELTVKGPTLKFHQEAVIAITGADMAPHVDDMPVPCYRPVHIPSSATLSFTHAPAGWRSYIAVAGGFDLPAVLGSRSTCLLAGQGGFQGRALQQADELPLCGFTMETYARWLKQCQNRNIANYPTWYARAGATGQNSPVLLRIIEGRQSSWFSEDTLTSLVTRPYEVSSDSNRMGYRLQGDSLNEDQLPEMRSEAVSAGSIQVPPDGQPIILMADRQPTGGYPKIAQVISADLPKVAQMRPGQYLYFYPTTLSQAQQALLQQEYDLARMRVMLQYGLLSNQHL